MDGKLRDSGEDVLRILAVADKLFDTGSADDLADALRRGFPADPDEDLLEDLIALARQPRAAAPQLSDRGALFAASLSAARARFDSKRQTGVSPSDPIRFAGANFDFLGEGPEVVAWSAARALNFLLLRRTPTNKRAAVVTAMRDDGIYALEWIAHYQALGFELIVIYSNDNADGSETLLRKLAGHGEIIFVETEIRGPARPEVKAFDHALNFVPEFRECEWGLFVDSDEFLNLAPIHENRVGAVLDEIERRTGPPISAVLYEWLWYNSGMIFERRPGTLAERFQYASPHWLTKPLARLRNVLTMRQQHIPELLAPDSAIVGSTFQPVDLENVWTKHPPNYEGGQINHYWPKSFQEFSLKKARGDALPLPAWDNEYRRAFSLFFQWNAPETPDTWAPPDPALMDAVGKRCEALRALPGVEEGVHEVEGRFSTLLDRYRDKGGLERIYKTLLKTTKWGEEATR